MSVSFWLFDNSCIDTVSFVRLRYRYRSKRGGGGDGGVAAEVGGFIAIDEDTTRGDALLQAVGAREFRRDVVGIAGGDEFLRRFRRRS